MSVLHSFEASIFVLQSPLFVFACVAYSPVRHLLSPPSSPALLVAGSFFAAQEVRREAARTSGTMHASLFFNLPLPLLIC